LKKGVRDMPPGEKRCFCPPAKLRGAGIYLKLLVPEDVTVAYISWMNDNKIVRFLESRWNKHTMKGIREYVSRINSSGNNYLFGIFLKDTREHIGNIKVGNINGIHRFGDVGLLIGDRKSWGKGYGTEAIKLATDFAFNKLKLNKLIAGIYADNIASYKAFIKSGYKEAGRLKNHRWYCRRFVDEIVVEKCRK
jgi:[ribosomal protein S5]-alanine N-acetyltransferase